MSERPEPPSARPGFRVEATAEDPLRTWRLSTRERQCRMQRCSNPAVAELNRGYRTSNGRKDAWWPYCAIHMYGRWIEDGRVMRWRLVEEEPRGE